MAPQVLMEPAAPPGGPHSSFSGERSWFQMCHLLMTPLFPSVSQTAKVCPKPGFPLPSFLIHIQHSLSELHAGKAAGSGEKAGSWFHH